MPRYKSTPKDNSQRIPSRLDRRPLKVNRYKKQARRPRGFTADLMRR